jgi:hypothetical protein
MKIKSFLFLPMLVLTFVHGVAQSVRIHPSIQKQTFIYAVKDSNQLGLDIYTDTTLKNSGKRSCVIFIFGGAFIGGHRDDTLYNVYFNSLAENNIVVVSISYRLGLRGVKHVSKFNIRPLKNAIAMAVEDTYDATNWIISNATRFGIDTSQIIISGSSSGGITALMSDFGRRNHTISSDRLPGTFEYSGVMAFAGAILSFDWGLKYKMPPAPTLLFHGTSDRLVPYNKIRFLNRGFYGSSWIAKTFNEKSYPYYIYRAVGLGHEEAVLPMIKQMPVILDFLSNYVGAKKRYQTDISFKDPDAKAAILLTPEELFKREQAQRPDPVHPN